ncbi:hypothetical protein BDD12DRAFT_897587 [Trichophaea hybrida]|nr:hypothetical protein BDD12DRAFT_897587 [Trichophaea hybrida]
MKAEEDFESSTQFAVGLKLLAEPENPIVDIVFVHGLNGHWKRTWTARNQAFWPADFLPEMVPQARIFSYGYDANTHGAHKLSLLSLTDQGQALVRSLAAERRKSKTEPRRPIIFIVHSLGGLVLETGLIHANNRGEGDLDSHKEVKLASYAVFFIGCPHQGGTGAWYGKMIAFVASSVTPTNSMILQHLQVNSEWLREHGSNFMAISKDLEMTFFYEQYATKLLGPITSHIVPQFSAIIPGKSNAEAIPLPGDHKSIVRFSSMHDPGFGIIVGKLQTLIDDMHKWQASQVLKLSGRESEPVFIPEDFKVSFWLYTVNENFCGREAERKKLCEVLRTKKRTEYISAGDLVKDDIGRTSVAICGQGGVGKSQLALQHAHDFLKKAYTSVLWISANTKANMDLDLSKAAESIVSHYSAKSEAAYQRFARILGIPEAEKRGSLPENCSTALNRDIVKKWLAIQENHNWLVIIDNSDRFDENTSQPEIPETDFLPSTGGSVIVTTRLTQRALMTTIELKEMDEKTSLKLFLGSAGLVEEELEPNVIVEAKKLVEKLGGLPIALDQAGAYIKARQYDIAEYHELLERHFKNVAGTRIGLSVQVYKQNAFYSTWEISYMDLKERCPIALEVLLLCAFLNNENIPEELLYRGLKSDYDEMVINEAIAMGVTYSLFKRTKSNDSRFTGRNLTMHPLQQKSAQSQLSPEDQQLYTKKVMATISSAISIHARKQNDSDWMFTQQMGPHLIACRENLDTYLKNVTLEVQYAMPAHSLGVAFDDLSLYRLAEFPYRKALEGLEHARGEQSSDQKANLIKVMRSLGQNLSYQSRHNDALQVLEPVLGLCWQPDGKKSQTYLATLYSIGLVYRYKGEYDKALEAYKVVYDGNVERHNDRQCTGALEAMNEIGYTYLAKRDFDAAQNYLEAAFEGYKTRFGPMHPFTLITVHFVASVYMRRGKYEDALEWYQVAKSGREIKLGKDHLATLATVAAIAETHIQQGRYEEGLDGYQRALEGRIKASGNKSMWTLSAVHGVGVALQGLRRYAEALEFFELALEGRKEVLGLDHPQTRETMVYLEDLRGLLAQEGGATPDRV